MKANIYEVFESIQGEGLLVGTRHIFVRFTKCNLRCSYCDTPASHTPSRTCRVYPVPGRMDKVESIINPVSAAEMFEILSSYQAPWISFTGGEPLLASGFIVEAARQLSANKHKILLETNSTLVNELRECLPYLDMVSLDFKLPSATGINLWTEHRQFLEIAGNKPCYVKVVITDNTRELEVQRAINIIAAVRRDIPLLIQPVTAGSDRPSPDLGRLLYYQTEALRQLDDVRIIPQIHPYIGMP